MVSHIYICIGVVCCILYCITKALHSFKCWRCNHNGAHYLRQPSPISSISWTCKHTLNDQLINHAVRCAGILALIRGRVILRENHHTAGRHLDTERHRCLWKSWGRVREDTKEICTLPMEHIPGFGDKKGRLDMGL